MRRKTACSMAMAVLVSTFAGTAAAHLSFDKTDAKAGRYFIGHLRVTHGCDGAATQAVRVEIPEGVLAANAQPKPGWTVSTERAPLAAPADLHGKTITDRVSAIIWSGGSLPDDQWDEFGVMAKMPDTAGALYFPTIQTCAGAEVKWAEIPAEGQAWGDVEHPAPVVTVVAADADPMAGMPGMGGEAKPAVAADIVAGPLNLSGVTVPETPGGNGALYLTIRNDGPEPDRLAGGSTELAAALELHTMSMNGSVMEMRKVEAIDIPAGGSADFQPGQNHIMLIGLKAPLREGMTGTVTLHFERQGDVVVPVTVSARSEEHDHH